MKRLFAAGASAVLMGLLLLATAQAALAGDVKVRSVDNYAGSSTVYTDKASTSVTVTELDENGSPVGSWTGTTDEKGRVTVLAGHSLNKNHLKVRLASGNQPSQVESFVLPDSVYDRQPFSFSLKLSRTQTVSGEVVQVRTVEGVVVERKSPDKLGRVFLPAGLPAGAYLISRASGSNNQMLGKIDIKQAYVDPWDWTGTDGWVPIPIDPICLPPGPLKLNDAFTLQGKGFSANFDDVQVTLSAAGKAQTVPVLAATAMQLKLAPVEDLPPGTAELRLTNKGSGRSARPREVMLYELQGHLERNQLKSGEQTTFVLNVLPANVPTKVRATISGKATFSGGRRQVEGLTEDGRMVIAVEAKRGAGGFNIVYEGRPETKTACSCGCGGTPQPACAHKACVCSQ